MCVCLSVVSVFNSMVASYHWLPRTDAAIGCSDGRGCQMGQGTGSAVFVIKSWLWVLEHCVSKQKRTCFACCSFFTVPWRSASKHWFFIPYLQLCYSSLFACFFGGFVTRALHLQTIKMSVYCVLCTAYSHTESYILNCSSLVADLTCVFVTFAIASFTSQYTYLPPSGSLEISHRSWEFTMSSWSSRTSPTQTTQDWGKGVPRRCQFGSLGQFWFWGQVRQSDSKLIVIEEVFSIWVEVASKQQ